MIGPSILSRVQRNTKYKLKVQRLREIREGRRSERKRFSNSRRHNLSSPLLSVFKEFGLFGINWTDVSIFGILNVMMQKGNVTRYRYGMIHGRFQPFHREHLRYFHMAWERSENVLVGITNPDPSTIVADDLSNHRHLPEENPFSFTERLIMVTESLREEGYDMGRIYIVPFPIHHPDRWKHYIPRETALFVVVYSDWERKKAERLSQGGFNVIVEDRLTKKISGQQIRSLMATGGKWQHLVPPAVARFLNERR